MSCTSSTFFSSSVDEFPFSILSSVFESTSSSVELPPLSALESTSLSAIPFSSADATSSISSFETAFGLPRLPKEELFFDNYKIYIFD